MAKFRKKPVMVEAVVFNPQAPVEEWPAGVTPVTETEQPPSDSGLPTIHGWFDLTLPRAHSKIAVGICAGSWIVTEADGTRQAYTADIFKELYEAGE